MTFFGSSLTPGDTPPDGAPVSIEGLDKPAVVHKGGMTLTGNDGKMVSDFLLHKSELLTLYWYAP